MESQRKFTDPLAADDFDVVRAAARSVWRTLQGYGRIDIPLDELEGQGFLIFVKRLDEWMSDQRPRGLVIWSLRRALWWWTKYGDRRMQPRQFALTIDSDSNEDVSGEVPDDRTLSPERATTLSELVSEIRRHLTGRQCDVLHALYCEVESVEAKLTKLKDTAAAVEVGPGEVIYIEKWVSRAVREHLQRVGTTKSRGEARFCQSPRGCTLALYR